MAIQKILTEPNKILRQISLKVENVDKDAQKLMDDLLETLYAAPGIGLAAIQIGIPKRGIVIDLGRDEEKKNPMYFVNPEIITKSTNNSTYEEGCLSVPGQFAEIDRPDSCFIKYLDYHGEAKKLKAEGDYQALDLLPRDSSKVRLRNRCNITGRGKGFMRMFGISRIKFRELASHGKIPGVRKASW